MDLLLDLAHGDAIIRKLECRIRRTGAVIRWLRNRRDWKRVYELRKRT
jgi:hypothetical protein